ncbi:MAG: ABC transporter permease [Armatimonadetes bacterium]|nr:ABC transporter permease [Armatimonadota bacterium]MDE2207810.1 ABC transporter permease [Armatimonadota bacterium]
MQYFYAFLTALDNLRANKLRSALTMLGVIIGVTAVIMMVAILEGSMSRVTGEFQKLGSNLIIIVYNPDKADLKKTTRRITGLTMEDVAAIQQQCNLIGQVSPEMQLTGGGSAEYEGRELDVTGDGVGAEYAQLRNAVVQEGRFISNQDVRTWAKVCVIGSEVKDKLFLKEDPIGKDLSVNGIYLTVVGVLEPKGRTFNGDADLQVFIPISTVQKRLLGTENVSAIYAEPVSLKQMDAAKDQVWRLLMLRYNNLPGFTVDSMDNILDSIRRVIAIFTMLLGSIAGLALLVGGIGIMNIMLVSVTERTREIGLRKAVGARGRDILLQFLIEAAVLSGTGGLTGVLLGSSAAWFIGFATQFIPSLTNPRSGEKGIAMYVPPSLAIGALVFSAGVGMFFGIYPAYRASKLDPIEALRHE